MIKSKNNLSPWYSEKGKLFNEHYLKYIANTFTPDRTRKEVDFLERILKLTKNSKILDLACGHGRHSIELAKRGYKVTGLDLNNYFLRRAAAEARKAKVQIKLIKSDMRRIPFKSEFNFVICLATAFGYLENDAEDFKVIQGVSSALKKKGKFLLDIDNREYVAKGLPEKIWRESTDGSYILINRKFDLATSRLYAHRILITKKGEREEEFPVIRMYSLPELISIFKHAGVRFKKAYGSFDYKDYGIDSERCITISQKQ